MLVYYLASCGLFLQNGTPPSEIPDKNNNQPHIVAIERDEYFQYMIAVEQSLMLECTEIATAIFMMLACHYVFNQLKLPYQGN